jgi:signal transduction histidine kinase
VSLPEEPGSRSEGANAWRGAGATLSSEDELGRLRELAACLLSAQEAEQRRISREIHDDVGQKLALLEIKIERMKREADSESAAISELESLRGGVAELADDLRRICHGLHPVILDNLGLAAGIASLCEQCTRMSGVAVKFMHSDVPQLTSSVALCIYRVVQEALNNVTQHSQADRATVILCGSSVGIQVVIRDAGCGFDVSQSRANHARPNRGMGLKSVCERIRLLGGKCEIRSKPGRGTRITAFVPLSLSVGGCDSQIS